VRWRAADLLDSILKKTPDDESVQIIVIVDRYVPDQFSGADQYFARIGK